MSHKAQIVCLYFLYSQFNLILRVGRNAPRICTAPRGLAAALSNRQSLTISWKANLSEWSTLLGSKWPQASGVGSSDCMPSLSLYIYDTLILWMQGAGKATIKLPPTSNHFSDTSRINPPRPSPNAPLHVFELWQKEKQQPPQSLVSTDQHHSQQP